jgi:oligopeptide/dipeptide ABC transporter ATP-binding protein
MASAGKSAIPLLEVRDLVVRFPTGLGLVRAVNGISYTLERGQALALVGESGAGKSVGALSILGLLPPPGRVAAGAVRLEGVDLLRLPPADLRRWRGRRVAMVFQDPSSSLNPVLSVGYQLTEVLREHLRLHSVAARNRAADLLSLVGIPAAKDRLGDYPHEFSGGQRQRIMIAMALAGEPSVLIADEPTTALDVTVQAQIVDLVRRLQKRLGMGILWVTHDLALAASLVDEVAVMYAGLIVERAPVRELLQRPRHPYTKGLLRAMPSPPGRNDRPLEPIPGSPPFLREEIRGCPFEPRCFYAEDRCRRENPPLLDVGRRHASACWRWEEL